MSESGNGGFKRLYVPFVVDVGGHKEVRLWWEPHYRVVCGHFEHAGSNAGSRRRA